MCPKLARAARGSKGSSRLRTLEEDKQESISALMRFRGINVLPEDMRVHWSSHSEDVLVQGASSLPNLLVIVQDALMIVLDLLVSSANSEDVAEGASESARRGEDISLGSGGGQRSHVGR